MHQTLIQDWNSQSIILNIFKNDTIINVTFCLFKTLSRRKKPPLIDFSKYLKKLDEVNWRKVIIGVVIGFIVFLIFLYILITIYTLPVSIYSLFSHTRCSSFIILIF